MWGPSRVATGPCPLPFHPPALPAFILLRFSFPSSHTPHFRPCYFCPTLYHCGFELPCMLVTLQTPNCNITHQLRASATDISCRLREQDRVRDVRWRRTWFPPVPASAGSFAALSSGFATAGCPRSGLQRLSRCTSLDFWRPYVAGGSLQRTREALQGHSLETESARLFAAAWCGPRNKGACLMRRSRCVRGCMVAPPSACPDRPSPWAGPPSTHGTPDRWPLRGVDDCSPAPAAAAVCAPALPLTFAGTFQCCVAWRVSSCLLLL